MGAKQANERQFDEIYRAHRSDLYRLGLLICGDRTRSEDAVAEVFAKVLPRWRAGTVLDHPASYLRRALVNELTGGFRRRAVERRVAARQWGDDRGRPQLDAEISEHEQMRAALMLLPTAQRAVLVLRYYADLSEIEIADLLHVSPGTVKSRAARAMARLREIFEEDRVDA